MNNSELKIENHIIAFIDILGSSEAIKTDAESSLNMVHKAYANSLSMFQELFGGLYIQPSVKIFSDNIVVAVPYKEDRFKRSAFLAVAMMSAIIQVEFLKKGWLTRGGISSGSFFADEVMVWGTALVKAYKLESTVAVYPRVVIDPDLIGDLHLALSPAEHCIIWLRQDKDRLFYIEYLNHCLKNAELFAIGLFKIIEENLARHKGNTKVCQKWLWLSSYLKERLPELGPQSSENRDSQE